MGKTIEPLYDRVIIRRAAEEDNKTVGGLYIPDAAREKPQEGEVVAVGQGNYKDGKLRDLIVDVGDTVIFGKFSGSEISVNGEQLLIMREDEILGIVRSQ